MSRRAMVATGLVLLLCGSVQAQHKQRQRPTKAVAQVQASLPELPPQPEATALAAPDLTVVKFEFGGPIGPWRSGQRVQIGVVVQNVGQWESGVFMTRLVVRTQVPQSRLDATTVVGDKRTESLPARRTGVATGSTTVWFDFTTAPDDWAQYTFTATVDSTEHIREFDEANNESTSIDQIVDMARR